MPFRLLPLSIAFSVLVCQIASGQGQPRVLLLGDDYTQTLVALALRQSGMEVTAITDFTDWNGAAPSAADHDVILFLCGNDYGDILQDAAGQAIAAHVAAGKGLVVTEWAAYDAFAGTLHADVAALLPVVSPAGADMEGAEWNVTDAQHPILTGLPESWSDKAYISIVELRSGAQSVAQTTAGVPLISIGSASGGTVVHLNHGLTYNEIGLSAYAFQLLINATYFAAGMAPPSQSGEILLLGDNGSELAVATGLLYAGLDPVFGGVYGQWDGVFPDLSGIKTVVFLDGVGYGEGFSAEATSALSDYVAGGGGLVLTEWTTYDLRNRDIDASFASLMPVFQRHGVTVDGDTWNVVDPDHPVVDTLPGRWYDSARHSIVEATPGATVIATGRDDIPLVTEKSIGAGKVVHINHTLAYDTNTFGEGGVISNHVNRLIANAAAYTGGMPPPKNPNEGDVLVLGDSFTEAVLFHPLSEAGLSLSYASRHDLWDGEYPDPTNFKALLFLDGYAYDKGLQATAEQVLAGTVAAGKGLVLTEWISYDAFTNRLGAQVQALIPVFQPVYGEGANTTWTLQVPGHPILEGLPEEWGDFGNYSLVQTREGAEALVSNPSGAPMVAYWNSPGGAVVHLNHSMTYGLGPLGPEIRRLIVNSLRFAGGILPAAPTADLNGDGEVDGEDLLLLLAAVGISGDPADLDLSGTVDPSDVYLFSLEWGSGDGSG